MHRQPREEHERSGRDGHAHGQDASHAEAGHESLGDGREHDDRQRQRDVGDTGLERRIVQDLLHVQRQQEELREQRGREQQPADVRSGKRPKAEDPHRQERRLRAQLDDDERDDQRCGGTQQGNRRDGAPAALGCARHPVDEQHQPAGDRRGAGRVEVAMIELGTALTQQPWTDPKNQRSDGNVDEEDPRPAQRAGQDASEQHACRAAASGGGAPDAEREVSLTAFPEHRREDRQSSRREQRTAQTLEGAECDQRAGRPGEAVGQRAHCEEGQPCHEQAAPAQEVGHPAAEQ